MKSENIHSWSRRYTIGIWTAFSYDKKGLQVAGIRSIFTFHRHFRSASASFPSCKPVPHLSGLFQKKKRIFGYFEKVLSKNTRFVSSFYPFIIRILTCFPTEMIENKWFAEKLRFIC
jgi:hypothetical protein